MEIGPAHLISAGRRVLVGHGPLAKWPAPRAGALSRRSSPGTVSLCHPQTPTAPPFSRPRCHPHMHMPSFPPMPMGYHRSQAPFLLLAPHSAPPLPPHMRHRYADEPSVAPPQAPTPMSPCAHATPLTRARCRVIVRRKERPQQPRCCRLLPL
jgi:hypothetical protein